MGLLCILCMMVNCYVLSYVLRWEVLSTGQKLPPINSKNGFVISVVLQSRLIGKPICSNTWNSSLGNRRGVDSARVRFLRWTLSSKWNKEVMKSSARLNQKPSDMRYRASRIAPLCCMICWSGNRLDRKIWSIRSILGGSCLRKRIDSSDESLDNMRTISRDEGWGHSLESVELAKPIGKLNVAAMSAARSVPSQPSMEKWMAVGWGTRLDVIVW